MENGTEGLLRYKSQVKEEHEMIDKLRPKVTTYEQKGRDLGQICSKKNIAYGNSFGDKSSRFLEILYPDGVQPHQYKNMLVLARIFDKLMRIATDQDALGENPFDDIAGYCILMSVDQENNG